MNETEFQHQDFCFRIYINKARDGPRAGQPWAPARSPMRVCCPLGPLDSQVETEQPNTC